MPGFNAEIAFKALDRRVDRIDTLLASTAEQVKVLLDARGAGKEKAVEEPLKTLPAMRDADEGSQANPGAPAGGSFRKKGACFERLGAVAQAALFRGSGAAQKEHGALLEALDQALRVPMDLPPDQADALGEPLSQARAARPAADAGARPASCRQSERRHAPSGQFARSTVLATA